MKTISVQSLHRNTHLILKEVEAGQRFLIQKRGIDMAALCPLQSRSVSKKLPDREQWIAQLPRAKTDSGRILEQDR